MAYARVTIDYGRSIMGLVRKANLGKVPELILTEIKRCSKSMIQKGKIVRIEFGYYRPRKRCKDITEVRGRIEKLGWKPAGIEHVLAFAARYPNQLRRRCPLQIPNFTVDIDDMWFCCVALGMSRKTGKRALGTGSTAMHSFDHRHRMLMYREVKNK